MIQKNKNIQRLCFFTHNLCLILSSGFFIQFYISEIQNHIDCDFCNIQEIECPGQHENPASLRILVVLQEFVDDSEYITNPDEYFKEQALSFCSSGNPGFADGNRPGKSEAQNHQCFQKVADHFDIHNKYSSFIFCYYLCCFR